MISEASKFETDLQQTNEDIAPKSRGNLQTFEWWEAIPL